jgi:hypothetical protein
MLFFCTQRGLHLLLAYRFAALKYCTKHWVIWNIQRILIEPLRNSESMGFSINCGVCNSKSPVPQLVHKLSSQECCRRGVHSFIHYRWKGETSEYQASNSRMPLFCLVHRLCTRVQENCLQIIWLHMVPKTSRCIDGLAIEIHPVSSHKLNHHVVD